MRLNSNCDTSLQDCYSGYWCSNKSKKCELCAGHSCNSNMDCEFGKARGGDNFMCINFVYSRFRMPEER